MSNVHIGQITMWATILIALASIVMAIEARNSAKTAAEAVEVSAKIARADVTYQALKDLRDLSARHQSEGVSVDEVLGLMQSAWIQNELGVFPSSVWVYMNKDHCIIFRDNRMFMDQLKRYRFYIMPEFWNYLETILDHAKNNCEVQQ